MPFTRETLNFLADLSENNTRDWFSPRKDDYRRFVQIPMLELAAEMNRELARFAPEFCTDPKKAVFRVYRDVRFSKDKRPYKTNISALFWDAKVGKNGGPAFYVSVSTEEMILAGGVYAPGPAEALAVRQHIAENFERMHALMAGKAVRRRFREMESETLQRAPKGFAPDHPAIALLRQKSWVLTSTSDCESCLKTRFGASVASGFETLAPFVRFLNEPFAARARKAKDPLIESRSIARR